MKESEKRDIVLRGLYELRNTNIKSSPTRFLPDLSEEESRRIVEGLDNKGLVTVIPISNRRYLMKINSDGVDYCEEDSFSRQGTPIVLFTNIVVSDSSNIVIQIGDQSQINFNKTEEILNHILNIRQEMPKLEMSQSQAHIIIEKLGELESLIITKQNPPAGFWEWLGRIDSASSLGTMLITLFRMTQ